MAFSYLTAISRIDAQPEPVWTPGMSPFQKIQRINEVLERFWNVGTWDGLLQDVTLTSSQGIITLDPGFKTLDALIVADTGRPVSIKSQQWKYTPSASRLGNKGPLMAFDLGDITLSLISLTDAGTGQAYGLVVNNGTLGIVPAPKTASMNVLLVDNQTALTYAFVVIDGNLGIIEVPPSNTMSGGLVLIDGQTREQYFVSVSNGAIGVARANGEPPQQSSARRYQITGDPATVDTLTFQGMARRRYVWVTYSSLAATPNANTIIEPDCFQALLMGVRAFHWYDVGDTSRAEEEFKTALNLLEQDLGEVLSEEDLGNITVEVEYSGGSICSLM